MFFALISCLNRRSVYLKELPPNGHVNRVAAVNGTIAPTTTAATPAQQKLGKASDQVYFVFRTSFSNKFLFVFDTAVRRIDDLIEMIPIEL